MLFNLGKEGYSNSYYAAAVRSMLANPGLIVYNSFDPVGFVTVDKPPVSLWIQTMSAAIFGYSGFALILPQVIAGLCSVFLLYHLVKRSWGKNAGLFAAFTLTITPIFIAVARTNNMDGLLVFVLLAALFMALNAWRYGSFWYLLGAATLIGVGFNIKMIQAFVVVPACFGIYLLNNQIPWKKKALHLAAASVLLLVISASWAVMMDLTPADSRPYIGSSSENSEMDLIFGYNGLNRLVGGLGPSGNHGPGGNATFPGSFPARDNPPVDHPMNGFPADHPPSDDTIPPGSPPQGLKSGEHPGGMQGGMMGGMNDGGVPGLFRMGDPGMSGEISWLLPFALIGLLAWFYRPSRHILQGLNERAVLTIAFVLWLVPELLYFSFTSGFYHTYYVVMVAVPLAGLVGIGATIMYEAYILENPRGWLLVLAILVTGIIQLRFITYNADFSGILPWIILVGSISAGLLLAVIQLIHQPVSPAIRDLIVILGISILCVAPFIWSCTPAFYPVNPVMPSAGPALISGSGSSLMPDHGMDTVNTTALYSYLITHQTGEKYLVGVESSRSGSDLIINHSARVMTMGGFSGSDPILTRDTLKQLISSGTIRYFLVDQNAPGMPQRQGTGVTSWISDSCQVIPDTDWNTGNLSSHHKSVLYDCEEAR